jgi:hypothetical protein
MCCSKDELSLKVVVRRVAAGAAPYGWELRNDDAVTPVHASRTRFRNMEAAFKAGRIALAEYLVTRRSTRRSRSLPHLMTDIRLPLLRPDPAGALDDEHGVGSRAAQASAAAGQANIRS